MPQYRLFRLDEQGHVSAPPAILDCRDDEHACIEAEKLVDGGRAELWHEKRLILRFGSEKS